MMLGNVHTEIELMIVGKMAVVLYNIFGILNAMCCYVWQIISTVLAIHIHFDLLLFC